MSARSSPAASGQSPALAQEARLSGARLAVSDDHDELKAAIARVLG
jgi:hypothetical protein